METSIASKLTLLNQTVLDCLNETSEPKIMKAFSEAGMKVLKADFGFAWLKASGQTEFELIYKSPKLPYEPARPRKYGRNREVIKTGRPYFVTQAKKLADPKYDVRPYMQSYVIIPVTYRQKTYGNIVLCFKKKRKFDQADKSLCTFLGNGAAQAIIINRFYGELEDLVAKRTKQLKESNMLLEREMAEDQAIFSSIGEGLIATNREGKIILTNPQAEAILGCKTQEMAGKVIYEEQRLIDERNNPVPLERRPMHLALTRGERVTTSKYCCVSKDGRSIPLSITAAPVHLGNEVIGAIQVFRDISEEKEIDRAKSELISLASHQLRTPLAGINWYVEALIKEEVGKLNKQQKKYLQEVHHANQKLVELVYDFLNVSRIELGTFNIKLSIVDVKDVVKGILNELGPTIAAKKMRIQERYQGPLNAVRIDHKVIRLILQNLITNAAKYTHAKGTIGINLKLEASRKGSPTLEVVISDTGVGIPEKDQPKIFSKLFRADNIKPLDADGTGLGLYMVKSFTELCNGKIRFESQEGKGTKFFVTLPVQI